MDHFVVSARKYRPAVFASVVGQGHITSTLKNAIARNQLAHAYLFCGPRGVGKTTCARIFAKAINCLNPKDWEACGECESCRAFNEERSFNIHELDAASNNSVDDIRTLTDQVRIPPQIGRYSVYIIDEVHMLSASAFNAFLKTLEEPPAHAVFILATTEKHKIIPTILSRCQIYDFNRIRVEDSVAYLKYVAASEGVEYDDESLNLIAQKADGGMRDALSMFDKAVSFCGPKLSFKQVAQTLNVLDYDIYFGLTQMLSAGDYAGALTVFDSALRQGFSGQVFISGLNAHLRDLLMCKNPQTLPLLEITGTLLERYKQQAAQLDVQFLFHSIAVLTELEGSIKTALNQRLHVELGLMKLSGLGQKKNSNPDIDSPALPPLTKVAPAPKADNAPQPATAEAVQPASVQAASPKEGNAPAVEPTPDETPAVEYTAPPSAVQPEPVSPAQQTVPEQPAFQKLSPDAEPKTASISGQSIASILSAPIRNGNGENPQEVTSSEPDDPDAEKKIIHFGAKFIHSLQAERPRIAPAFTDMKVEGNTVSIVVGSQELHDEIVRNRIELTDMLCAVAGVTGRINLQVRIVESHGPKKPIKIEDRLKYLEDKNPLVVKFRRELDLEPES